MAQPLSFDPGAATYGSTFIVLLGLALVWRWWFRRALSKERQATLAAQRRIELLESERAQLLRARQQTRHPVDRDDLTGLWDQRFIVDRLRREVDRAQRQGVSLSVILADVDHFRKLNEKFGRPFGDLVLKEIAAILQRSVRSYDWVGRYGGEKFLLILPGSTVSSARIRAEQIRLAIHGARILHGEGLTQTSTSLGVASGFPSKAETLIHAAGEALTRAKAKGRNCAVAIEIAPTVRSELQFRH
jgi:diguanylate cyclase (GGDEF)-like protein